jgi:hypothetical protein
LSFNRPELSPRFNICTVCTKLTIHRDDTSFTFEVVHYTVLYYSSFQDTIYIYMYIHPADLYQGSGYVVPISWNTTNILLLRVSYSMSMMKQSPAEGSALVLVVLLIVILASTSLQPSEHGSTGQTSHSHNNQNDERNYAAHIPIH